MERTVSSLLKANTKQFSCKDTCESNQTEGVEALQSYEYAAGWNPIAVYPYVEVHSENKLRECLGMDRLSFHSFPDVYDRHG